MEVTRQLRLAQLTKSGLAQIQLTFCWHHLRLRLGSGQRCDPKDWDARRGRVKARPGTCSEAINQVLDDYEDAALAADHEASRVGRVLTKDQLRAEIEQRYQATVAERRGEVPLPALPTQAVAPLTFCDHLERWIAQEEQKVSVRTGRKLTADTIWTHRAVLKELRAFSEATGTQVSFAGLNQGFYDALRDYVLGAASRSPRTFNNYVKRLRSFLF